MISQSISNVLMRCAWNMLLLGLVLSCAAPTEDRERVVSHSEQRVINGDDNRQELSAVGSAGLKTVIENAAAAVVWTHRIRYRDDDGVELRAQSLAQQFGLCADERYASEPSWASCSATLVDDDLVLTAAHCLGASEEEAHQRCQRLRFVFEYEIDESGRVPVRAEDVYACRAVAAFGKTSTPSTFLDFAFVQLDRAASGRAPATIRSAARVGERVAFASHGAGLPLKVEEDALVVGAATDADYFVAATDSFAGGSGGGVYDAELQLLGYVVRGAGDWIADGDCMRAAHSETPSEEHQLASSALSELCARGWPSSRLCATQSQCGDGICNSDESTASCGDDCAEARCGDGVCDFSERVACAADCPRFEDVPTSWDLDPLTYVAPSSSADSNAGCAFSGKRTAALAPWLSLGLAALSLVLRRRRNAHSHMQ